MRLFYAPGACSLAPHIVAREAGLDLHLEKVDLATKRTEHGADYLKINRKGGVPALIAGNDAVLSEAAVIIQYLADLAPESQLLPRQGTFDRYRAAEWLNFIATELHKGFSPLWNISTPNEAREMAKAALAARFNLVESHLNGRAFLLGEQFTAVDAYAFTILNWAPHMSIDLGRWPNLSDYVERVRSRPRVQQALAAEGLIAKVAEAA